MSASSSSASAAAASSAAASTGAAAATPTPAVASSSSSASASSSAAAAATNAAANENPVPATAASSGGGNAASTGGDPSAAGGDGGSGGLLSLLGLTGEGASTDAVRPSPPPSHAFAGGMYTGGLRGSVPHGRGKLKLPSGVEVSGEWADGTLSVGVLTNPALSDSLHYEGELSHFARHGKGMEWRLEDGEINRWGRWENNILVAECPVPRAVITEGAFLAQEDMLSKLEFILADGTAARYEGARNAAGEPHGVGSMLNAKGEVVRGHAWHDGAQDGEGFFVHVDGERFTGHFKNGFKHGYGSHLFPDGELYEGQFRLNRKHGAGKQRWDDGYIYEGLWTHDEQNGWGIEYTKSGKISACGRWKDSELKEWHAVPRSVIPVGTYLNEKARVVGADLLYSDGGYYKGEVNAAHEAHGKGILYTASNSIVQGGLFQHGKLHGEGFTNHPDGGRYSGEHRAGLREGFGKLSLANGDKYVGAFASNLQHGRGQYTWAKGDVYDGSWSDVRMHGIGKYSWPDGIVYLGEWVLGLQTGLGFKWSGLGTRPQFGRWLDNKLIQSLWVSPAVLAKMPGWTVEEFKAELEGKWAEMARTSALQTAKVQRTNAHNAATKKANGTASSTPCTCTCKAKPCTCACPCDRCVASRSRVSQSCCTHPTSATTPSDEWSVEVYDLIVKMRSSMEPHQFFSKNNQQHQQQNK